MKKLLLALLMVLSLGTTVKATPQNGCPTTVGVVCLSANIQGIVPMPGQAQVGIAYNQSFTSVGSVGSVTWSTTSTATQNGLTLNTGSSASVTGSPTNTSADSWNIHWVDSVGRTFTGTINIQAVGLTSVSVSPSTVNVNEGQTQQFRSQALFTNNTFADVTSTATWSCTTGSGCTGSTISSSGLFTAGTAAGNATVQASFGGQSGTGVATVVSPVNLLSFQNNDPLPNGQKNQPYSEVSSGNGSQGVGAGVAIQVTGGTPPYTCSVSSGSLPTGLTLNNCLIAGIPTISGAGSSFTIQVTDSASNSNTKVFSSGITVASLSSLVVNLAQSSISSNAGTTVTAVGTYSDSSTASLPAAGGPQIVATSHANAGGATSKQLPATATTTGWFAYAVVQSWNTSACSATTMSMTSPNETFTSVAAAVGQAGAPPPYVNCVQAFYAANVTGANDAPTCNFSVADGGSCFIMYVTGMPTSSVIDQSPAGVVNTSGTATSCVPNSITTTQVNELIVHVCFPNSASSFTPPTGFTATFTSGAPDNAYQVDTQVTNAVQTGIAPAASFSPASNEIALLASFKATNPAAGGVVWSSSNTACAWAFPLGHIQGQSVNTSCSATITGTVGAVSNTATITVTPNNTDTGIVVSPANPSIALNSTQQFTANGNVTNQQYTAAWGSSNTTVATINSSSGLATCLTAGTASITAAVSGFTNANTTLTCTSGTGTGRIFYIDHASGNNANAGTKVSPWQSQPFMQQNATCNSNNNVSPSYSHQTGDEFIFKGGVTWPSACLAMIISQGGSSASTVPSAGAAPTINGADYYGVDTTWFTGSSFTRPIFDAQGTTPSGVLGAFVKITANNVTLDDIEMKNALQPAIGFAQCQRGSIDLETTSGVIIDRLFIHDWSIGSLVNQEGSWHAQASICSNIGGAYNDSVYNTEMSDAAQPAGSQFGSCFIGLGEVAYSNCHNVGEGALFTHGSFHDNQVVNLDGTQATSPSGAHSNAYESDGVGAPRVFYNNYFFNDDVGFNVLCPGIPIYNNVIGKVINSAAGAINGELSIDTNCGASSGTQTQVYNNTIDTSQQGGSGSCVTIVSRSGGQSGVVTLKNNVCIGVGFSLTGATVTPVQSNNTVMNTSDASMYGFLPANKYAPTSADPAVSGAGANLSSLCSGNLLNLCSDTSGAPWFGGTYQTRQPAPTPWSLGAYKNP